MDVITRCFEAVISVQINVYRLLNGRRVDLNDLLRSDLSAECTRKDGHLEFIWK